MRREDAREAAQGVRTCCGLLCTAHPQNNHSNVVRCARGKPVGEGPGRRKVRGVDEVSLSFDTFFPEVSAEMSPLVDMESPVLPCLSSGFLSFFFFSENSYLSKISCNQDEMR